MYGRHQKQALTFMLRREQGWGFYNREPDVWEIIDMEQGRLYVLWFSDTCFDYTTLCSY